MEFTELADYPLPAGTLTEWTPVAIGNHWRRDDRPLSHIHEHHCLRTSSAAATTVVNSWLGAVFEMPYRFDADVMGKTLRAWLARHDAFHTTITAPVGEPRGQRFTRYTCPAEALGVDARQIGHLRTGTRVYQHITEYFESRLSPTRWPHCLLATVADTDLVRDQDTFLLVFGADHSVMDAYSMMLAISEIHRIYRWFAAGERADLPSVGSSIEFGAIDRRLGDELTPEHPAVGAWRRYLDRGDGQFPPFPLATRSDKRRDSGDRHQSGLSAWVLTAEQADALEQRCRRAGHSTQTAVLATLAATNRELTGAGPLRFAMPMHTRHDAAQVHAMGWYVGIVPIEIDIGGVDGFDGVLDRAATAVSTSKPLARYPFPRIARILGSAPIPRFVVSYLDVRYIPDAAEWQRWGVRPLRSSERSEEEVYFWIARSPGGLAISARFPSNEVAAANVHRYINTFTALLSSALAPPTALGQALATTTEGR